MREKIIKYLQGMQCEWFPVEWDSFIYNCLGIQFCYEEEQLKEFRIKYSFRENNYWINFNYGGKEGKLAMIYPTLMYFTLERCKTLLLNAVRSVDEPKREQLDKAETIERYEIGIENDMYSIVATFRRKPDMEWCKPIWQNGKFK